ncbi:hypothetical protein F2Q69_00037490 [Brassica cretica]|uniref:Helicase C-terminal domain-containing protein n=1 Tax=Brassica cretica TaxID=69181 RepID=A0A8S9SKW5_BRACR|nr:hypothetical protein F2Q69_00037490 [Brassica cretica]
MMFSATIPSWIRSLTKKYLNDPLTIDLFGDSDQKLADGITTYSIMADSYGRTSIIGSLVTSQRERTLAGFRDGHFNIPVATDVAARGLGVPNVDLVIHYELPNNTETFVHRTGRTGRAGKKGSAILIYSQDQSRAVKIIEREVGSRFTELPSIAVERGGSMFEGIGGRSGSSFGSSSGGGYGCTSGRSGNRYSSGGSDRSSQSSGRIRFGGGFGSNDGKSQRERTLAGFRDGHFNIPVATDVAARGLGVPNVDLVIHYELPNNTETFVHRTGRTGRAGKKGSAILIYSQDQSRAVKIIEREVGSRFTELPSIAVERGGSMFEGIGGRSGSSFGSSSGGGYGCTSGRSGNRYSSGGSDRSSQSSGRIRFGGGFGSNDGKRSY